MTDRRKYSSARTEDSYNYSDDFSDDDISPVKSAPEKQRTRGRGRNQGKGRGRGRGQGRQSQARSDTHVDVVTKRLLSANRMKVNELQNQVEDMRQQMKLVTDENKLFKRMQHKQEKALVKFEDRESELPQMIQSHNNEVRALREQLRRTRDKYDKTDRYLRDAEDELERANKQCKKYKSLSDQKDLAERSDLDRRLNKAELAIEEKECKIRELERHTENLKKNHRHELGIERARYKETQRQLDEIKDTNSKLETVLREKEKLLDAQNIYSNRLGKPSSYNGTPAGSPAPWRQNLMKKKSESMSDLAARDKARAYEEKRRVQGEKKKETLRLPKLPLSPKKRVQEKPARSREPKQKWEEERREKDEESAAEVPNFNFSSLQRQDSDGDFWRRQEQRYKQDKDNREKQEEERKKKAEEEGQEEQARFQQQRDKFKQDMEERERRERERREADEREHRKQEQQEREEEERKEKAKKEAEQRERQRKENERRVQEERDRVDNDPRLAEDHRKKEELLRRLMQLDGNRDGSQPPTSDPFAPSESTPKRAGAGDQASDPFAVSPSRRADKDPFGPTVGDSSFSSPSSKADYAFTRSIENMHKGKPAHEDVSVPYIDRQKKGRAAKEDEDIRGYQPSFSSSSKAPSDGKKKTLSLFDDEEDVKPAAKPDPGRKDKLMADLFGSHVSSSQGPSAKKDEGEGFFMTSKSPSAQKQAPGKKSAGFPWDNSTAHNKTNGTSHQESTTLFGGGAALVDDDLSGSSGPKSTMLPKRSRQASSTFNSKPAMVTVDNLDDDIEEVVL